MTDKCPICLEELRSSIGTITPCGHCLHIECFQKLRMATKKVHGNGNDDENNDCEPTNNKLPRCPVCKRKAKKFVNLYLTLEDKDKTNHQQKQQQQQQSPRLEVVDDDDSSCIPLAFDQRERSMSTTSIGTAGTLSSETTTATATTATTTTNAATTNVNDSDAIEAVRNLTTENFRLQKSLREVKSLSRDQSELLLDIMPKLQHLETRLTATSHEKSLIEKELRLVEDENSELISDWNNVELKLHMLQSEKNELQIRLHQSQEENNQLLSNQCQSIVETNTKLAKAKRKRKRIENALQEGWMSQRKQAKELEKVKDQICQSRNEKEELSNRLHQSHLETIRLKKEVKRLKKNKKQKLKQKQKEQQKEQQKEHQNQKNSRIKSKSKSKEREKRREKPRSVSISR